MTPLNFPEHGISITENEGRDCGLMISQNKKTYLARNWTLSNEVRSIITDAVNHGFNKLWCRNNPLSGHDSAHYVCFARDHDGPWDFKLAAEGLPKKGNTGVHCITVNACHEDKLDGKVRYCRKTQKINGKERVRHLEVKPWHLHQLMRHI